MDEGNSGWEQSERGAPVSPRTQRLQQRSSLLINPPLEGFLLKKGAKGITLGWKRRWFVLSDQRLYYYKSSDAARHSELGFIDLRGSYEIEEGNDIERCHFRIRTPDRLWYLAADAEEECRFWLQGLRSFKKRQQRLSQNNDTIARLRSESEMRLAREGDIISPEEEMLELKRLLEEAELEIEDKARHVDELYHDLQNSIQIIRLKNNQVDMLSQRLEAKSSECQRLHELIHKHSQEQVVSTSPNPSDRRLNMAHSPPSPLWARNSWQGGAPSGFPLWRAHKYNASSEHRVADSLPSPHRLSLTTNGSTPLSSPSPSIIDHASSPTPDPVDEESIPLSAKLLYEIRQLEGLLPSPGEGGLSGLKEEEDTESQKKPLLSPQLSSDQFLEHLARSMNSFAAFVEGTDNASHEAITYWVNHIRQHIQQNASVETTLPAPSTPPVPEP